MKNNNHSWNIGDDRQRSPDSGEFETVDTVREDDGQFRSPSSVIRDTLSVGEAMSVSGLVNATGISEATIVEHLNRLQAEELVEEAGRGWSLTHDSQRVDSFVENYRRRKEEAAEWEYNDDDSLY